MNKAKSYLLKIGIISMFLFIGESLKAEIEVLQSPIHNFKLKENLLNSHELEIAATDSWGNADEKIDGNFLFVINGFTQTLHFTDGLGFCKLALQKSSFLYIKHKNETSKPAHLFFVYKTDNGLNPFKISWYLLLAIPIGLILMGYMFKKIIGMLLFLLAGYMYFNHSYGLSMGTFFESVFHGLKNLF